MTKSTITREQATDKEIQMLIDSHENGTAMFMRTDAYYFMAKELQERRKAERDSEPVAWLLSGGEAKNVVCFDSGNAHADPLREVTPLYRHAQQAPERDQVRSEHAEWSQATFGNVGPVGPLKHLSKEALEAAAEPGDLSEWADMQFLLWDAQRRAGITDEQITQAMIEKLVVNKQREWPEPNDGEPRLHIKSQPAPVLPDEMPCGGAADDYHDGYQDGWNACRAAMLQDEPVTTANKLPPNSFTDDELEGMAHGNNPQSNAYRELLAYRRNSPVIPDGSEDTKRLNWLDAQNKRLNEYYGTSYGWKFDANFQRNAMMLNDSNYPVMTVRQAIDEAIAAAPQEVK